ncbi:MAG: penicillin acylase family protein [Elusimicrobia bacterium]|nr:penicillin acylase family protein [Elusimicrobiota bacterium]
MVEADVAELGVAALEDACDRELARTSEDEHEIGSGHRRIAAVEFGPRVRAKAITAGGESGDPGSAHFADQAARYAAGNLRDVYFYSDQLAGHATRRYRPGEPAGPAPRPNR